MATSVNCYFLRPTRDAPNNPLPVLHYQNVLPKPLTEDSAKDFLTANKWEHRVRQSLDYYITITKV